MKLSAKIAVLVVAAGVIVALLAVRNGRFDRPAEPNLKLSKQDAQPVVASAHGPHGPPRDPAAPPTATNASSDAANTSETVDNTVTEETHYYNGLDPNQQPRKILHIPLAGLTTLPNGYETTGTFQLAKDGWTLAPAETGPEAKPRIAMVESPPIALDFQTNAVNPLWKEVSPAGTEVLVEVSLSEDGTKWTDWMPTTSGHYEGDMSPKYPDGSPNPNYGYTLGEMTFYGLKRFQFFKFAITMYSEVPAAPVVSDFRLYYQDSTMGDAEIAQAGATPSTPVPAEVVP